MRESDLLSLVTPFVLRYEKYWICEYLGDCLKQGHSLITRLDEVIDNFVQTGRGALDGERAQVVCYLQDLV